MNPVSKPAGGAIHIGDFVVDPRSGELYSEAGRQALSTQPLQVLLTLAERPGVVVTRDELRARLWPADTFVDFEHGLNAAVKRLRDALGDAADAPHYIETVPRRGYRLIAPVVPAADAVPMPGREEPADVAPPASPRPALAAARRFAPFGIAAVLAVLLAAGSVAYIVRWRPGEAASSTRSADAQLKRITFGPGLQTDVAWSPDGRRIAFAADRDGTFDLFTQALDDSEPVRITTSPANETQPAWSPNGQRLVFRSSEGGGSLFTVSANGGPIRRIASFGARPVWMPDGHDIAFTDFEWIKRLYLVRADGGEAPREILEGQLAGGVWASFAVHPDGRIGVYGFHATTRYGFYVSDRDHRALQWASRGTPYPEGFRASVGRAHWSKTGDAVFIEHPTDGVPAIWRVPVDPATQAWRTPVRLATGPVGAVRSAISPDGNRLAFTSIQSTTRAWVFPFDADRGTPPGEGRALTDEDASIGALRLSADGSTLFYGERRAGRRTFRGLSTNLDTGETTVLVDDSWDGPVPSSRGSGTAYTLSRPTAKGSPRQLDFALAWRHADGTERLLSPWTRVAVVPSDVRRDDSAVLATMIKAFGGPGQLVEWPIGPLAVAKPGRVLLDANPRSFWQGKYSPDGRWVSFVTEDGHRGLEMGVAPADRQHSATWTRIAADHAWPDKPRWSPDGRTLYFLSRAASDFFELWGVRMDPARGTQAGAPFQITAFDSPRWHIEPNVPECEIGIGRGRLALPMRTVTGSIWLLSNVGS